jgi:hypothetical protein
MDTITTWSAPDASQGADPEYYDAKQLSVKLNVSVKAVQKWTAARRVPCVKVGRLWRYPAVDINKRLLSGQLLSPETKERW